MPLQLDSLTTQDLVDSACYFLNQGKHQQSAWFSEEALLRDPTRHDALANLGGCYLALGRYGEAKSALESAIRVNASHPGGWFNMAMLHRKERRFEDERTCLEIALAQDAPNLQDVIWCSLAHNSQYLGKDEQAIEEYKNALTFNPENDNAKMSIGILQMKLGNWKEGLPNYEARLKPHPIRWASDTITKWGDEDYRKKRRYSDNGIVVCAEQGTGDLFQYARYGELLHETFPIDTFSLFCSDELVPIMNRWPGWKAVYSPASGTIPEFDSQIAMMTVPLILSKAGVDFAGVDFLIPPVKPLVNPSYKKGPCRTVGMCWRGNPLHPNNEFRSLGAEDFRYITGCIKEPIYYSFQNDAAPKERDIFIHAPYDRSWLETARDLQAMDVLITCDTAVAHLAGSLGVPTWILLPLNSDFRWGAASNTTPLYPSVRLFRQKKLGDWKPVICEVIEELEKLQ